MKLAIKFFAVLFGVFALLYLIVGQFQSSPYTMAAFIVFIWKPLIIFTILVVVLHYAERTYYKITRR